LLPSFAFDFNLRRYSQEANTHELQLGDTPSAPADSAGGGVCRARHDIHRALNPSFLSYMTWRAVLFLALSEDTFGRLADLLLW